VQFFRSEDNLGFAGGNNLALPFATGEYLFFVNNDAQVAPECIGHLVSFLEENITAGVASPLILAPPAGTAEMPKILYAGMTKVSPFTGRNKTIGAGQLDRGQFCKPRPTAYAHGAAMMVPRRVVDEVGAMWASFFLYYEELDWCERIRRAGYGIWLVPQAKIWHEESLTLGKMGTAKTYYLTRNRILFMRRNANSWQMGVFSAFFLLVSLPKNFVQNLLRRSWPQWRAFWKGFVWNLNN
jgi:Predicted glycosyltransferases